MGSGGLFRADVLKVKDERGRAGYRAAIRDIDYRVIWIHPSIVSYHAASIISQYKVRELTKYPISKVFK